MESVQASAFSFLLLRATCVDERCHVGRLLTYIVCDTLLIDPPAILNEIIDEFAMLSVCGNDFASAMYFTRYY